MNKVAVIDIGTYSTRMLIASYQLKENLEESIKTIKDILSLGKITSLGKKVQETGYIQQESMLETLTVLKEYVMIAKEYKVENIIASATQACRIAKNASEFLLKVKSLGIDVSVISGEEEAKLSFLATAYGVLPESSFVVIDQGGGSTEFAYGKKEDEKYKLIKAISFPFGIVNLTEKYIKSDPPKEKEIEQMREYLKEQIKIAYQDMKDTKEIIGLGGTITTVMALEKHIYPYDSSKIHNQILTFEAIDKWLNKLSKMTIQERKAIPMIEDKRAEAIISGIVIFHTAMQVFNTDKIKISEYGLRHGRLIKYIADKLNVDLGV